MKDYCIRGHKLENNRTPDNHCLTCSRERARAWAKNNPEKHNAKGRAWYHSHRQTAWIRWIKNAYQMTEEMFGEFIQQQNNCCAVCGKTFTSNHKPCVDHDHTCCPGSKTCGKCTRGLLCRTCNYALGMFENPEWRAGAEDYLAKVPKSSRTGGPGCP